MEKINSFVDGVWRALAISIPMLIVLSIILDKIFPWYQCDENTMIIAVLIVGLTLVLASIVAIGNYAGKRDSEKVASAVGILCMGFWWVFFAAMYMIPAYGQLVLIPVCT